MEINIFSKVGENILSTDSQVKSVKLEGNHLLAIPADFDYMVRSIKQ